MPTDDAVRWNIKVSRETDLSLRSFLGSQRTSQGDLSKFIEQAVLAEVFHRTVQDIHARNRDADTGLVQAEIDAAVLEVRHEKRQSVRLVAKPDRCASSSTQVQ
jgi:hypothetical protein